LLMLGHTDGNLDMTFMTCSAVQLLMLGHTDGHLDMTFMTGTLNILLEDSVPFLFR
jgi:hypothetical protein